MKLKPAAVPFFLMIGLFASIHLHAQSSYGDYSALDKTFKLREDFNSSNYTWESEMEGKSEAEIKGGALVFKSLNDKAQAKYTKVDGMNWSGDWELEIGVRWVNGKENSSVDFIWDRTPGETRKYHFGFTAARKYNISEYHAGYQQIVGFTRADFVYRTTRNRMTVRHVNGYYYFFVNERFVKQHRSKTITGDHIGFMVPPGSVIEVDYLYARQLKKKAVNYSSSNNASSSDIDTKGGYIGVMTKNSGYNLQRWKTRDSFPKDAIKSDWDDGFSISDVSYDNGKWSLIMSKGTGYSTQTWITRREWKKEDIKEKWDQGYKITEVNYGNGVYAIVFSKTQDLGRQRWATKISSFPSDKIREFGNDGLKISEVIYGKDRWVLVATEDSRIKNQKWFKRAKFPAEDIKTYTNQGYAITQLSKENNWWVLVMSQYHAGERPTVWFNTPEFPKTKIREYWDQGYYLTDITYVPKETRSTGLSSNTTNAIDRPRWKEMNLQDYLIGTWYKGDSGEGKQGYLRFNRYRDLMMVTDKDTLGGPGYTMSGVTIDLKYEWNSFNTPNQLDFVFFSVDGEIGRMKGIMKRTGPDEFQFKMVQNLGDPRPSSFTNEPGNQVVTFRRSKSN